MRRSPALAAVLLAACQGAAPPAADPVGLPFPEVTGNSLAGDTVRLPAAYAGEPVVLLVGYRQRAQFDADRWLYGILNADLGLRVVELPAVQGLVPSLASQWIDDGMRSGIPQEDWGSVVTLYGGAASPVAAFTGVGSGNNVRVLLLDAEGVVRWYHDRGFSAATLKSLEAAAAGLAATTER